MVRIIVFILARCSVLACVIWVGLGAALHAQVSPVDDAKNRISLAARQSMLIQQISRDACFVMAGIQPQRYAASALSAVRQYDITLHGLANGDGNLRIDAEEVAELRRALDRSHDIWRTLGPASQQIASGDLHTVPMGQLLRLGRMALVQTEDTARAMAATYGPRLDGDLGTTLWAANRLATHAMKAANEICLISLDIDKTGNQARLAETIVQMDTLIFDITQGNATLGNRVSPDAGNGPPADPDRTGMDKPFVGIGRGICRCGP